MGWIHIRKKRKPTKENTSATGNSSHDHPPIPFNERPPITEAIPDVVSC